MMDYNQAEYLANTYADLILRLSYTYLKNTHDAQDICQTVFVRLLTRPIQFDSPAHEKAYIIRMTINACKDILKSPWRKKPAVLMSSQIFPHQSRMNILYYISFKIYRFAIELSFTCIITKNTRYRKSDSCSAFLQPLCTPDYLADERC